MVMINSRDIEQEVKTDRFSERMKTYKTAFEVTTGRSFESLDIIKIPAKTAYIFELKK